MKYETDIRVEIPKKTIIYKTGNRKYVHYTVKPVYRKDKKNHSDIRVTIGKVCKNDDTKM